LLLAKNDIEPTMEHMPGMSSIVRKYSGIARNSAHLTQVATDIFTKSVKLLRFMFDGRYHQLASSNARADIKKSINDCGLPDKNAVGQNKFALDAILALTEDTDDKRAVRRIVESIEKGDNNRDRKTMQIYNIIDMNIIPINVHALMREVPFIHLKNYAFTFDRLVTETILSREELKQLHKTADSQLNSEGMLVIQKDLANAGKFTEHINSRRMFAHSLVHPYHNRIIQKSGKSLDTEYNDDHWRILSGIMTNNNNLSIGRLKFNSDQLWSKYCIQNIWNDDAEKYTSMHGSNFDNGQSAANVIHLKPYGVNINPDISLRRQHKDIHDNKKGITKSTKDIDNDKLDRVTKVGLLRYNTRFSRNFEWFVNLQRFLQLEIRKRLMQMDKPITRGISSLDNRVSSFSNAQGYTPTGDEHKGENDDEDN